MAVDALARTARWSAIASASALLAGGLVGNLALGTPGMYGALMGVGFPTVFFGITLATALLTKRSSGATLSALILGSWLVKLILLVVVLAVVDPLDFYHRPLFGGVLLGWTAVLLGVEVRVIKHTRQPYVEPV